MYIYFVYVSDELGHNFGTVSSFIKDIVKEIKGTVENLEMVHYIQKVNYVATVNSKHALDLKNIYVYWNPLSRGEIILGFVFHHTDYKLRGGDIRVAIIQLYCALFYQVTNTG
jgi:hypothetical protein